MKSLSMLAVASITALWYAALTATTAHAGTYPEKPVRLLVGFAPGGPTDVGARVIAEHLSDDLKQPFIVENRPGAGGNIATQDVAAAAPDGYTALVAGINLTINPWMTDIKVDSGKDLEPVRIVAIAPTVLVVTPNFPANNFTEFMDAVKRNPGKYNSAAPGSSPMLATVLFNQQTGARITPVPYKGAAPAMIDLMGGHVDLSFATLGSVLQHIKSGKCRALAIAADERDPELPDVPTFAELGLKDFRFDAWVAVAVPAGTAKTVIDTLSSSLDKMAHSTAFEQKMLKIGMKAVVDSSPEKFGQTIKAELDLYKGLAESIRKQPAN
jgi:tripartite-type tricarboxylate transporter receptor subunit TctC